VNTMSIAATDFSVPIIDLTDWENGDVATRMAIAADLDRACRTVGFMQIVGHGVPSAAIDGLVAAADEFFGLSPATKLSYTAPSASINRGYSPPGSERLSYSLGVDSPVDLFEAFNIGANVDDFPALDLDPEVYARNIWPDRDAAPTFQDGATAWYQHAGDLARTLTSVFALALGLPDGYFAAYTDHSIDVLRMVNYALPAGTQLEVDQLGMGAHTDYGTLTVLWTDGEPGLQVLSAAGEWRDVDVVDGGLVVNLGDLMARWTNDRWRSTMHRVTPVGTRRRLSIPFFHNANWDARVECIVADAGSVARYPPTTAGRHLMEKFRSTVL